MSWSSKLLSTREINLEAKIEWVWKKINFHVRSQQNVRQKRELKLLSTNEKIEVVWRKKEQLRETTVLLATVNYSPNDLRNSSHIVMKDVTYDICNFTEDKWWKASIRVHCYESVLVLKKLILVRTKYVINCRHKSYFRVPTNNIKNVEVWAVSRRT